MAVSKVSPRLLGAIAVALAAFAAYVLCATPTAYPLDSAELATAAFGLGVAHPPGEETSLLWAKLFTLLPFGSVAFKVALSQATAGALAAVLVFLLVLESIETLCFVTEATGEKTRVAVAAATALAFAYAPGVVIVANRAEVYAVQTALSLSALWLALRAKCSERISRIWTRSCLPSLIRARGIFHGAAALAQTSANAFSDPAARSHPLDGPRVALIDIVGRDAGWHLVHGAHHGRDPCAPVFLERRQARDRDGTLRYGRPRGPQRPSGRQSHPSLPSAARWRPRDRLQPLPNLRVSGASLDGKLIDFIQEGAKQDGELSLILPHHHQGHEYTAEMEYEGNKVIQNEGQGNYSVGARENWYPAESAFRDRATYDITFHAPKGLTLVGVKLVSEKREGGDMVTDWKSDEPLLVAGSTTATSRRRNASTM